MPDGWAMVHACKHPCHSSRCGTRPPASSPHYLSYEDGPELFLNIIDPESAKFFRVELFQRALVWMQAQWEQGKRILIHCNKGESRSASLAMLFAAKVLRALPDTDYDAAWDGYEALTTDEYLPGAGIEAWLRENWRKLDQAPIPYIAGAAPKQPEPEPMTRSVAESIALVKHDPFTHFAMFARIVDKDERLTPMDAVNYPNIFQIRALEAYHWCLENNVPIRLVLGPKPRQSGGSTISAELCYHHSFRFRCSLMVIGDENDRTDLLWTMINEMARNDRAKTIWDTRHEYNTEKARCTYEDVDGIERQFEWLRDTANDPKAGASGTRRALWFSEAGRYSKDGKVTDVQVISNAMSSVPEKPGTLIIMESTAEGANGKFYDTVKGAVTLEERKRGIMGNGFIKVSCWWWECREYQLPRNPQTEAWFRQGLDDREKAGVELYKWTPEQIAWRRSKIEGQFKGAEALFDQEFPESENVAFLSSGSPRFSFNGLVKIKQVAEANHGLGVRGYLSEHGGLITFIESNEEGWLWVREKPMHNLSYLLSLDCMTGIQSAGSKHRDTHAPILWRAGYMDKVTQVVHKPRVAAVIDVPGGCRWDDDIMAERAHLLSKWAGNCLIGIEVNEALGVLALLKKAQANLWKRVKNDDTAPGQQLSIEGWKTTPQTRRILVDAVAKAVRDGDILCEYLPLAEQLFTFEYKPDGSCAAKQGCLDDFVLSAGIGLTLMDQATVLSERPPVSGVTFLMPSDWDGKGQDAFT